MTPVQEEGALSWDAVERMIQELEDGVISPEDHAKLMKLISEDPRVCELYFEYMETVALLKQSVSNREALGTIPVSEVMLKQEKRKNAVVALSYGIAAVLILGLGFFIFQVSQQPEQPVNRIVMEGSVDARYTVVYSGGEDRDVSNLQVGDKIALGQGLVRLTFPSGVEAIVEGPSQLELTSPLSVRMDGGLAWFKVPEAGHGFTVNTEGLNVVDLGTEFGVWFDTDDSLQVHVAEGKVRVEPVLKAMAKVELVKGDAMTFDVFGRGRSVDSRLSLFRREFTRSMPYLHWSFDQAEDGVYEVTGTMPGVDKYQAQVSHLRDAKLIDPKQYQIEGRYGGAFSMKGKGLFADTVFPGIEGNAPRSFVAWVRHRKSFVANGARTPYCVWGSRELRRGAAWKILMWKESSSVLITSPIDLEYETEVSQQHLNEWTHIASVYTGRNDEQGYPEVYHYMNGVRQDVVHHGPLVKVDTESISTPTKKAKPLRFGASLFEGSGNVSLDGDLDEVYLFRGVLTEEQVKQLMEENRLDFFAK